jgi:anaerobic ribonucleoside-triphosphate reductase activating protein
MILSIHRTLPGSCVNGPGNRFVLWLQGCCFDCPGCFNQEARARQRGRIATVEEMAEEIIRTPGIVGASYSGGEPFLQARALTALSRQLHAAGLGVLAFTGYTDEELAASRNPHHAALLAELDILVSGRYDAAIPQAEIWAGSGNQRTRFLTERYADWRERITGPGGMELHIEPDGTVLMTGYRKLGIGERHSE